MTLADFYDKGDHTIKVVKQTESNYTLTDLMELTFLGSLAAAPAQKDLYIEFIGDSLTCGMGNLPKLDGTYESDNNLAQTSPYEDGTQSYGYIAADKLNADVHIISEAGIGLSATWFDPMPDFYKAASYKRSTTAMYNFKSARVPDVVVINLGTNDFSRGSTKEQFEQMNQQLDSIMQKNKSLEEPFNISKDEKTTEEIKEDLNNAEEKENNGDQSGADEKKKDAGKKMKEMADKLSLDMSMSGMEQLGEDVHLIRILLENVVRSSHEEEKLMSELAKMKKDDPSLSDKISRQKEISNNFEMVEDSLRKMAMRQPEIKNFVFNELQLINQQLALAMKEMNESSTSSATSRQQRAMMAMNNLALMLSESLNNMNESMMESSGSCSKQKNSKKPKKGSQSMKDMKDLQEQLGKQLEQMRKEMQQQQQQQKEGKPQSMSEEFARMAAEQEMLREGMQKMLEEMKKEGLTGDDGINEIIKDMEKLEEDLVNKKITNQTINRNKEILSRMLKAQNAQEEREKEEKRKSEEFKGTYEKRKIDEIEYEENLKKQQEFLKQNSIEYQPFYKSKINDYFFKKNANKTKE